MKITKLTIISGVMLFLIGAIHTSCSDALDLAPIDYYGSGSYWKTEAQATGYIDGIHKHLRDAAWQHTIIFVNYGVGTTSPEQVAMAHLYITDQSFSKTLMPTIPAYPNSAIYSAGLPTVTFLLPG